MKTSDDRTIAVPTETARRFVKYVLGFGVGIAVALAPYLGLLDIPLFRPLLSLYPITMRDTLLPVSAAVMGFTAVAIEWYAWQRPSRRWLNRWFVGGLASGGVGIVLLLVLRAAVVVDVPIQGGADSVAFVVAWSRAPSCPCTQESDALCIAESLTLNPAQIESCWGSRPVRVSTLLLQGTYMLVTVSFGIVTGVLVLQAKPSSKSAGRGSGAAARSG